MPDTSYEIIIRTTKSKSGSSSPSDQAAAGSGSNGGKNGPGASGTPEDTNWLGDVYGAYKAIKGFAPAAAAISVGKNIFNWQIGLVGRNMGNSLVQEKINYGMSVATQVLSSAGMFGLGLATGNPIMMVAGVASGINSIINYAKENEQFNYDRGMENVSRQLLMERAGPSFNRSRREA